MSGLPLILAAPVLSLIVPVKMVSMFFSPDLNFATSWVYVCWIWSLRGWLASTSMFSGATPTVPSLKEPIQFWYSFGMVTLPPWVQAPVQAASMVGLLCTDQFQTGEVMVAFGAASFMSAL